MKELRVNAIENGTVIDHIPPQSVMKVAKILGIGDVENTVLIGTNLDSNKLGKKGVIKVANRFFESHEVNKICLFAPKATMVTIENFEITKKEIVQVPDHIEGIVKCPNQKCITNFEQMDTRFKVIDKADDIKLKCMYCEKIAENDQIRIL